VILLERIFLRWFDGLPKEKKLRTIRRGSHHFHFFPCKCSS
jgi:hypothetical protein